MTGYQSKKDMAQAKLDDGDALTIAYQSGYYDGKKAAQPEQEPVADGLIRDYINALLANKPDLAAKSTKRMVDYVFATPPAAQPAQEPVAFSAEIVADVNGTLSTQWADWWVPNEGDKLYTHPPQRKWVDLTDISFHKCSNSLKPNSRS